VIDDRRTGSPFRPCCARPAGSSCCQLDWGSPAWSSRAWLVSALDASGGEPAARQSVRHMLRQERGLRYRPPAAAMSSGRPPAMSENVRAAARVFASQASPHTGALAMRSPCRRMLAIARLLTLAAVGLYPGMLWWLAPVRAGGLIGGSNGGSRNRWPISPILISGEDLSGIKRHQGSTDSENNEQKAFRERKSRLRESALSWPAPAAPCSRCGRNFLDRPAAVARLRASGRSKKDGPAV